MVYYDMPKTESAQWRRGEKRDITRQYARYFANREGVREVMIRDDDGTEHEKVTV